MKTITEVALEDTAMSYDEWKESGFFVIKGSKSRVRGMDGTPLFTADQVREHGSWSGTHWDGVGNKQLTQEADDVVIPKKKRVVRVIKEMGNVSSRVHFGAPERDHRTLWEKSADAAQKKGTRWGVVEDFDSFVREAGMLPDLKRRTHFAINDPLEMHFMNVADKHGILDGIIDGYEDDYY